MISRKRPPAAPDYSRSSVSRYIQLSTLFKRRIENGEWTVGNRLPTVDELAAECKVARETVRQALHILANEGLIERFRAKGTFVKAAPTERLWCDVRTDFSGLLIPQQGAKIEILSEERNVPLTVHRENYGKPAPLYRHLQRRHWRRSQAFLLAEVYIDESLLGSVPRPDFKNKTALRLLVDIPGVTVSDVHQVLTVATADMEVASMLDIPLNAPVAVTDRYALDESGRLILFARGTYRGDVVRLDLRMSAKTAK